MTASPFRDPARSLGHIIAGTGVQIVAAGAGDAVEVVGESINRLDYDGGYFLLMARAVLSAGKKLSIIASVEEADDNGSGAAGVFAAIATGISTPAAAGTVTMNPTIFSTPGATVTGVGKVLLKDLSQLKEWIRIKYTPDLDAGATDTAQIMAVFIGSPVVMPGSLIGQPI